MSSFLIALKYLTILPINLGKEVNESEFANSLKFFPLVGLAIGLGLVITQFILSLTIPSSIVKLIIVGIAIAVSGGRYLEDMAYTIDSILFKKPQKRESRNSIYSNMSIIAASSIFIFILAKYIALGEFLGGRLYAMLLVFPMIGRMNMVTTCWMSPSLIPNSSGKTALSKKDFVLTAIVVLIIGLVLLGFRILIIFAGIVLIAVFMGKYLAKLFGGAEKHIFGVIIELGELVALLVGTMVL